MLETLHQTADGHATEGVGFLDQYEYNRFVWAWEHAGAIASWLYRAGNISSGDTDVRIDSSPSPALGLPATYLAADEISRLLTQLNTFRDEEQVANSRHDHWLAIELGRVTSSADRRWPREDKPHRVRTMRCRGCGELTLTFRPPRYPGDLVKVDCKCGHSMTETEWAVAVDLVIAEKDTK